MRIWRELADEGAVVWGIASREGEDAVRRTVDALGITFPVLLDTDGAVDRLYDLEFAFPTGAYPQDFVVGVDGRIVYASNEPDVEAIEAAVRAELAGK